MSSTHHLIASSSPEITSLLDRASQEEIAPYLAFYAGLGAQTPSIFPLGNDHAYYIQSKSHFYFDDQSIQSKESNPLLSTSPQDVFYDLASLTKPMVTALWFWTLESTQQLKRTDPLKRWINLESSLLQECPLWHLVNHSSGLPAHFKYYEGLGTNRLKGMNPSELKKRIRSMLSHTRPIYVPGEKSLYSDLGYLLLEWICEKASGESISSFWTRTCLNINQFFGSPHAFLAHFNSLAPLPFSPPFDPPPPSIPSSLTFESSRYIPTEHCPWRGQLLRGEVHDDNTWLMGGVAGHAGLFGRLTDVVLWAVSFLKAFHGRDNPFQLSAKYLRDVCDYKWRNTPNGSFVLGWDTPSLGYSSAGSKLGPWAIGHLGFTGTSLWMDVEQEIILVLLTNRVCPNRTGGQGIRWLRPSLHDAAWAEFTKNDPHLKSRT